MSADTDHIIVNSVLDGNPQTASDRVGVEIDVQTLIDELPERSSGESPSNVSFVFDPDVEVIDSATGFLVEVRPCRFATVAGRVPPS